MSYRGRRKMGMFDHAKYSQPVFRNISQSVLTAVKKDVAALLQDPLEKQQTTKIHPLLGQKRPHSPIRPLRQQQESNGGNNFVPAATLLPNRIQNEDYNYIKELLDTTPPQPKKDQNARATGQNGDGSEDFPEKPPMKKIVDLFMQSHPSVTLRPTEPTTLSDATFSLVRRALIAAKERNIWKERARAGQSSFSTEVLDASKADKNPFQTISDQTLFIQDEIDQNPFQSLDDPQQTQYFEHDDEIYEHAAKERNIWKERARAGQFSFSTEVLDTSKANKDPFQTISDQTPLFIQDEIEQNPFQSLDDPQQTQYFEQNDEIYEQSPSVDLQFEQPFTFF